MPPEQRPATVLIIQDQADIRTEHKAALENAGFRVVEVESREDAPALLRDASLGIDLLITSADEAGLQLAIEADRQGLPIIITAWGLGPSVFITRSRRCSSRLVTRN
jgi:DNA-binding NtrC family response regulator